MLAPASLLAAAAAAAALLQTARAETVTYDWNVTWLTAAPDGYSRAVIGINDYWPLPTINASVGDTVVVNLYNALGNESTGLHFHGIYQNGTTEMDGPAFTSQCPLIPGSSMKYEFNVSGAWTESGQWLIE